MAVVLGFVAVMVLAGACAPFILLLVGLAAWALELLRWAAIVGFWLLVLAFGALAMTAGAFGWCVWWCFDPPAAKRALDEASQRGRRPRAFGSFKRLY